MRHRKERGEFIEKRGKALLQKEKRIDELRGLISDSVEYVELNPPVRSGWTRHYVLREDVRYWKDAKYIQEALSLVNRSQFSRRKDFKSYSYKLRKLVDTKFELGYLTEKEYNKLSSERVKSYFVKVLKVPEYGAAYYRYELTCPDWMFKLKAEPRFLRYRKVYNTKLESEYYRLWKEFYNYEWRTLNKYKSKASRWDDWDWDASRRSAIKKYYDRQLEEA